MDQSFRDLIRILALAEIEVAEPRSLAPSGAVGRGGVPLALEGPNGRRRAPRRAGRGRGLGPAGGAIG